MTGIGLDLGSSPGSTIYCTYSVTSISPGALSYCSLRKTFQSKSLEMSQVDYVVLAAACSLGSYAKPFSSLTVIP